MVTEKELMEMLDFSRLPRHIAIIMDGNGRWAQRRGLPRYFGHRAGVESLRETVRLCVELGIEFLTVYAFSTENWKRPREEVDVLMGLLVEYVEKEIDELCRNGVRLNPIGILEELPSAAKKALKMAVEKTRNNRRLILNVALNYGGRAELVRAVAAIARKAVRGEISLDDISEEVVA